MPWQLALITSVLLGVLITSIGSMAASGDSINIVTVEELELYADGETVNYVEIGRQASIRIVVANNANQDQEAVILLEVRDSSGVTMYLAWQSVNIGANSNYTTESSWLVESGCVGAPAECTSNYQLRSFVVTSLMNTEILGPLMTVEGITVIETTEQGNRLQRLEVNGKEYRIEYSMDSGFIQSVAGDRALANLVFQLDRITNEVSFRFPDLR